MGSADLFLCLEWRWIFCVQNTPIKPMILSYFPPHILNLNLSTSDLLGNTALRKASIFELPLSRPSAYSRFLLGHESSESARDRDLARSQNRPNDQKICPSFQCTYLFGSCGPKREIVRVVKNKYIHQEGTLQNQNA